VEDAVVLLCDGTFNFSLNEVSICKGKVWPFSQISTSFLIFSYKTKNRVSGSSKGEQVYTLNISFGHLRRQRSCESRDPEELRRLLSSSIWAYLLIIRSGLDNIVHQDWKQFLYSMNTSSEGSVLCSTVYRMSGVLGLFCPLSRYRVYDVQYAKFVSSRGFLEMGVQLLDEYGFRL
jgi:hypothetical protein